MHIPHPLYTLRKKERNSQQDLATLTGLSSATLSRIERAVQLPTFYEAKAIGNHYGIQWHKVVEACVEYKEDIEKRNKIWAKISETSKHSHVCITSATDKGGASA